MKTFIMAVLLSSLGAGCVSLDSTLYEKQVHHWVPIGTPVAQAQQTMERHHFNCVILDHDPNHPLQDATLSCKHEPNIYKSVARWETEFAIRNGRVADYKYIDVL